MYRSWHAGWYSRTIRLSENASLPCEQFDTPSAFAETAQSSSLELRSAQTLFPHLLSLPSGPQPGRGVLSCEQHVMRCGEHVQGAVPSSGQAGVQRPAWRPTRPGRPAPLPAACRRRVAACGRRRQSSFMAPLTAEPGRFGDASDVVVANTYLCRWSEGAQLQHHAGSEMSPAGRVRAS